MASKMRTMILLIVVAVHIVAGMDLPFEFVPKQVKDGSNISIECLYDLMLWVDSIQTERWAKQMLDAYGKIPSGLMEFNINSLGQYDQCLSIYHDNGTDSFRGKYCLAGIPLKVENMARIANVDPSGGPNFNIGICIPSSCKGPEIEYVLMDMVNITKYYNGSIRVAENRCSTIDPLPWDTSDWCAIYFFAFIALLLAVSTAYDVYIRLYEKGSSYDEIFTSFSLWKNTEKLFKSNPSSLKCLNGLRAISIIWVILGHRYALDGMFPTISILDGIKWSKNYSAMLLLSATVSVDTFFFLSGMLLSYIFLKQTATNASFNIFKFYLHRILRLTPVLAAVILFQATLFRHIGSGPLWTVAVDGTVPFCRQYWWKTLVFLQNYVNSSQMCLVQTWYLAADTQLYFLSPILLYPLLKSKNFGLINLGGWMLIALITLITIVYSNNWPAAAIPMKGFDEFLNKQQNYYIVTHTRALTWLIGFTFGYIVYHNSNREIRLQKMVVAALWSSSLAIMAGVIFGMKSLQDANHVVNKLQDGSYDCFSRSAWALAIGMMVYACVTGYGGPVNWFLGWRVWEVIGKLSYSMYLLHYSMQYYINGIRRFVPAFSDQFILYNFCGDMVFVLCVSYLACMAFESPVVALERIVFRNARNRVEPKPENRVIYHNQQF